jgi:hypothetical protein
MSDPTPTVQVIIVNYRTPRLVVDCLRSLADQVKALPGSSVVVVDNASGDDSVPVLSSAIAREGWSGWVELLPSPHNGGFATGNNLAIRRALASTRPPDFFWLLNPDTVAGPGSLRALVDFLGAHPAAGICGGGIDEADGTPWSIVLRFPGLLAEIERGFAFGPVTWLLRRWCVRRPVGAQPVRVDWVSGATMMVRRSTFERVGLMDEGYFLYFEETDYCLQVHRAGIECWYEPRSRVMHIGGQSTQVTAKSETLRRLPAYWYESRRRFFVKNHGRAYAILVDLGWMVASCLGRLRSWLQRKPESRPLHELSDFWRHSALWRGVAAVRPDTGASAAATASVSAQPLPRE